MKIAGTSIEKGQNKRINLSVAKLITGTAMDVPVFVSRGTKPGPVLLLMAGLHGDEINSIDVIRQIIVKKINRVDSGTVICIPILNVFGFTNLSREVPDGKDVNRSFPGYSKGSLASQIAYQLNQHVLPHCDCIIDFHTGGKSRFNIPQTRALLDHSDCFDLAKAFNAPFTLHSKLIHKSLRETAINQSKTIIVYEGGESLRLSQDATKIAITGTKNVLDFLKMKSYNRPQSNSRILHNKKWLRAPKAGFFQPLVQLGDTINSNQTVGEINGPFADYAHGCLANKKGQVISINNNPMVNKGDAIIQFAY